MPEQTVHPEIIPPGENQLEQLTALYFEMKRRKERVDTLEAELRRAKEDHELLSIQRIPDLMHALGVEELRMADGTTLSIKRNYYGSVAQSRMPEVVRWLEARNMAGIVDKTIIIKDWTAEDLQMLNNARQSGLEFELQQKIHPSRLKALVRERIEANDPDFPKELFAASVVDEAVLKEQP